MNYIGSKHKLSPFLMQSITKTVGDDLSDKVFCDLFAGTAVVGRLFKSKVKSVIANDLEYYSYVLNQNYIGNHQSFDWQCLIDELNQLDGIQGFIFEEYSQNGKAGRLYFSEQNGKKIDAIRQKIEYWHKSGDINQNQYYFLLASLLESSDKVANTASVYGAYLKQLKKSAQKPLLLTPAVFEITQNSHSVYQKNANELICGIQGDILYLDPPYNGREYGANYHLLNTIALYDTFTPKGKTGLRHYQKSNFCKKSKVHDAFDLLIKNASFTFVFLSYNNEGIMRESDIADIMTQYGSYSMMTTDYSRFCADNGRDYKANKTTEYLHILKKPN